MQRNPSTEKFQAVVGRVKLANRVVRRLQFHTTRTVARAIDGPDTAPKRVGNFHPVLIRSISCFTARNPRFRNCLSSYHSPVPYLRNYRFKFMNKDYFR